MKNISQRLWNLQSKLSQRGEDSQTKEATIHALRNEIPSSLLVRFDQILTRGRKAVAAVRRGVCAECHIQLPRAQLLALAIDGSPQICGNCGRYLHLPEEESLEFLRTPSRTNARGTRRK